MNMATTIEAVQRAVFTAREKINQVEHRLYKVQPLYQGHSAVADAVDFSYQELATARTALNEAIDLLGGDR